MMMVIMIMMTTLRLGLARRPRLGSVPGSQANYTRVTAATSQVSDRFGLGANNLFPTVNLHASSLQAAGQAQCGARDLDHHYDAGLLRRTLV